MSSSDSLVLRNLGHQDYHRVWNAMQMFTDARSASSPDEVWFLQHPPVFTQGCNGNPEHLVAPGDIPVVHIDRGGQVTYHGPGQLVAYTLIDIGRRRMGVRQFVELLEQSVIAVLATYGIQAHGRRDAPGVYVAKSKIAALGLRVRRGRCYHGISVNVAMDLQPFQRINPCGYQGLPVTQLCEHSDENNPWRLVSPLAIELRDRLGYAGVDELSAPRSAQVLSRFHNAA